MAILQNKFVREDGSIIGSSVIISCKYTSDVNSQTNLAVGDVTADEVEVEVRTPAVSITAGEKLTYYQIEDGVENLIGIFYAEAPTIATKTSIRFKAYDGKAKLAADFSEWLNGNQDKFPMTLRTLVGYACGVAGLSLAADSFQFDSLSIPAFYAQGVTCRQIVSWAAQIAGCFASCNTAGEMFFDWYRRTDISISKTDFSQDGLSKKSYSTDLIKRVQFKQETNDVGVIYPADADGNVFSISQNGIAAVLDSATLRTIAQYLYEKLKSVTYTPLSVKLPKRTAKIRAGDIISATDGNGNTVSTYVMKAYLDGSGTQISSSGDQNYSDKAAVSSEQYRNIPGKVLLLEKSVDGLRIENKNTAGKLAKLEITTDGISSDVQRVGESVTKLEQTAGQVKVTARKDAVVGTMYEMAITSDGELALSYSSEKPDYYITSDGDLVLRHDGVTEPKIWIDEEGDLCSAELDTMILKEGELSSAISADGTWNSTFTMDNKTQSGVYFDFTKGKFVFDGEIVVGSKLKSDVTQITNDTLKTTNVLAENLKVKAAHITGTLTIGQLPDGVATADNITQITNNTIRTTNVLAENLRVKGANIQDAITFGNNTGYYINPSSEYGNYLNLPGLQIIGSTGNIGGFEIGSTYLSGGGKLVYASEKPGVYVGLDGIGLGAGTFYVRASDGYAHINSGEIAGWDISSSALTKTLSDEIGRPILTLSNEFKIQHTTGTDGSVYNTVAIFGWGYGTEFTAGSSQRYPYYGITTNSNLAFKPGTGRKGKLAGTWVSDNDLSDARVKNTIEEIPEQYETLFDHLNPSRYKYNNGTSGRFHTGFVAQEVDAAIEAAGLTTQDFAGVMLMDQGTDEEHWYLRRDEFVALNTWQIQKLKARVAELEKKLEALS